MNTSWFFGTNSLGNEKYSLGFSIASIGLPAATFPSNGTDTTSSSLIAYSFGTFNSIVLNLLSVWLI